VVEPAGEPNTEVTGDLTLAGWSAGNVEDDLLNCVLQKFNAAYPNVNVTFEVIAGEYPALMATRLGSDPPDLFYVNQAYSQDWIDQGLLAPLDQMATDAGFDLAAFYPGYLSPFQRDGQTYAFPKDSSVLGMQTNDELLAAANVEIPTTTDELVTAAQALKDSGVEYPMCFAAEWQRAGAFVHGFGGGLVDDAGAPTIDSTESSAGIQWYLDQYANGLAGTPADIGAGWCGEAFGKELVAISFEGNWIGPAMSTDYPDVAYTVSAIPTGPAGEPATLSYTVGYGIAPNAPNPDASWALLSYLTGAEGMQEWVNGGLVLPARSDVTPTSENQNRYASFAEFARPGEGVTPQWGQVSSAFNGALGGEATGGRSAQAVIDATLPALQAATGQ
jgi:multiple sugar transport system substrate-binding protein